MELALTEAHAEVLLVHLHIMRNSIKKVLKRNYGVLKSHRLLKLYDKMKDDLKDIIEGMKAEETFPFYLEKEELNMLHSFLLMYLKKVEEEIKTKVIYQIDQVKVKENMNFALLKEVQLKVNNLYENLLSKEGGEIV
ncbi:hypothetical protein [Niallia sp. 03091]|uniref:hypothetical protein n=1 Tax=unclassified Niallia TaxID=2837522 RepID=UPI0040449131